MANTFILIQTQTVGSGGAASVTFSSIPQTYTDLKLVCSTRQDYAALFGRVYLYPNGVTTNTTRRFLLGSGSAASSGNSTDIASDRAQGNTATASVFSNVEFYVPNYTSSNFKSVSIDAVGENNATEAYAGLIAGLWSNTAAITSIGLYGDGNFMQHSSFSLYGIKST